MNKEHLARLIKYQALLKDKLAAEVPPKHAARIQQYKEFLEKDLRSVSKQIEAQRLDGGGK